MTLLLCKLWPYLIGGLVGWLLAGLLARRFKYVEPPLQKVIEKRVEIDNPKLLTRIKTLEVENQKLAALKGKSSLPDGQADTRDHSQISNKAVGSLVSDTQNSSIDYVKANAAGFNIKREIGQDDFTVIEGIGPQINELIHLAKINTYEELSKTDTRIIKRILDNAGSSFKSVALETWPLQAGLAAKNEWEKLIKWQAELDGGKS